MVSGYPKLNSNFPRSASLGLLLLVFGLLPLCAADQPQPPAPPATENPAPLFIPKEELGAALSRYGKGVLIPWEEFQKLLAASEQDREIQNLGAAPILPEHSKSILKVEGTTLHVAADIQLRQWRETLQYWTLPPGFPPLDRATLDDQPAELSLNPQTTQVTLLSRKSGSHRLHLEYTLPIKTAPQGQFLSVPLLPSPAAELSLTLPPDFEIQTVNIPPLRESTTAAGKTLEWAVGGMHAWQGLLRSAKPSADKTSTLWVESSDQVQITRAQATWTSRVSLHPFGAPLEKLTADLPPGLTLTSVTGEALLSWKTEQAKEATRLQLQFHQLNPQSTSLTLTGFLADSSDSWNLTSPKWSSAGQTSRLTIEDSPDQLLSVTEMKQGELTDSRFQAARTGQLGAHHHWAFLSLDGNIQVRLAPVRPINEFQTHQRNTLHLAADRLELQSDVTLAPLARQVPQQVDLELPADWIVTHVVSRASQPRLLTWELIADKPAVHKLRIVWKQPIPPQTSAHVHLTAHRALEHWPLEENSIAFPLPMLQVAHSYRNAGRLLITSVDPLQLLPKNLQGLTSLSESSPNLLAAFQFSNSTASGELQVSRLPPQIAAMSLTSAQLERENLRCAWESNLQIGGGGTRQIRISLPERCGDAVRFALHNSPARIAQQSVSPPDKGERIWTLKFDRLLLGDVQLSTTLLIPRGKETSFQIPLPGFPDAERQSGQVAIEGDAEQQLIVEGKDAAGQPLPELGPAELKPSTHYAPQHRIVAAYRTLAHGTTITLQEHRHPGEILPVAYCRELHLKSILSPESPRLFEARWSLQAGRIAGWGLHLPNGARLWSVQLNGIPVEARHSNRIETFIAAPQDAAAVSDQNLAVIYEDAILEDDPLGTEHQNMPLLQVVTSHHEVRPLLVMAYHWDIHHSRDLVLSDSKTPVQEIPPRVPSLNPWEWLRNWTFSPWQFYQLLIVLGAVMALVILNRLLRLLLSASNLFTILSTSALIGLLAMALVISTQNPRRRFIPADLKRSSPQTNEEITYFSKQSAPSTNLGVSSQTPASNVQSPLELARPKAPEPQKPAQPQPPPQAPVQSSPLGMARLSVITELIPPADFIQHRYFYDGGTGLQNPTLVIQYCQLDFMTPQLLILAVGSAFVCWLTRKRPNAWRLWAFLGVILPLAAGAWLSREWHPLLLAAVNGTLAGGILVLLWHISQHFSKSTPSEAPFAEATKTLTTSLFLVIALSIPTSVGAAEPNAPPAKPVPPVRPAEPLLVPLDDLLHPEKAPRVWVPWDTYLKLKSPDSTHSDQGQPRATELHLQGTLTPPAENVSLAATFKARILLTSPDQEPHEIPLPFDQCDILSGQLNGQPAKLVPPDSSHPTWRIIVEKAGPSVLDAELRVTAIQGTLSKGQLTLPIRPLPAGTCELGFDSPDLRLSVRANHPVTWRKTPRTPQGSTLVFPLGQMDHPTVNWSSATISPTIARARTTTRVDLEMPPRVQQKIILELDPAQSAELRIPFPATLIPQSLAISGIAGWELAGAGDKRELVLTPDTNTSQAEIDVAFLIPQSPTPDFKPLAIPRLLPLNAQPQEQEVTITAHSGIQFQVSPQQGWKQIELSNPSAAKTPVSPLQKFTQVWRSAPAAPNLTLNWSRRSTPWKVQSNVLWHIEPERINHFTKFHWPRDTHNASTAKLTLPAGFVVNQVQWTSRRLPLTWTIEEPQQGKQSLLIDIPGYNPLPQLEPEIILWITGSQPRTERETTTQLTPLGLEDSPTLETWAEVELHPSLQANWQTSADWKSIDQRELPEQPWEDNTGRTSFISRVSKTPGPLTAQLKTALSQQTGTSLTIIDVQDDVLDYLFALKWEVTQAAEKRLSVTTPASLRGRLRFVPPSNRQAFQTQTEDAGPGRIRWTLLLEEPVAGPFFVIAHASLPPGSDGSAAAPALQFEQPDSEGKAFKPLATQLHYQSLVNHSRFQLEWEAGPQAQRVRQEEIDRSMTVPQELMRQSVDLLRLSTPLAENRWRAFSYQATQLLPASVNLADHLLWITPDGTWRAKVRFKITNRARQFLPIRLPAEATLLAAHAKGEPVRPLRSTPANGQGNIHLIPLPRTSAGDLAFEVHLVLTGKLTTPWTSWGAPQAVDLPLTRIISQQEDAALGIPVARELLTVYLPEKTSATVVHNPARTNAEFGSEDSRLYDEAEDLLSEMSSLIQIQSSSQNEQTRELAKNNLDLLNRRLDEYSDQSQNTSSEGKLGGRKQEFQRRAGEISRSRGLLEQGQEKSPPSNSNGKSPSTEGTRLSRKSMPIQQSIQGNDFLTDKAERLYQQNTIAGQKPNEPAENSVKRRFSPRDRFPKRDPNLKLDTDPRSNDKDDDSPATAPEIDTKALPAAEPADPTKIQDQHQTPPPNPVKEDEKLGKGFSPNAVPRQHAPKNAPNKKSERTPLDGKRNGSTIVGMTNSSMGGFGGGAEGFHMKLKGISPADRGTLSLPIDFQPTGRKLVFSHLNGDLKLALTLWPHEAFRQGIAILWTGTLLIAGLFLLTGNRTSTPWLAIGTILALLVFLALPATAPWGYFAGLLAILLAVLYLLKRNPQPA